MQYWTIIDIATGAVLAPAFATEDTNQHPRFAGWDWDGTKQRATRIAAAPDPAVQEWSGSAWVESAAAVEAIVIAQIKVEAEREKMASMTAGGAKKTEYADKAAEVRAAQGLLGGGISLIAALNLLTPAQRTLMFPYAIADAAEHGDTLDKALGRFAGGMTAAKSVPALAAREQGLVKRVKDAKTAADKRAVFAGRKWS